MCILVAFGPFRFQEQIFENPSSRKLDIFDNLEEFVIINQNNNILHGPLFFPQEASNINKLQKAEYVNFHI